MGLEERVRAAWLALQQSAGKTERFHSAFRALCQLLNVPATAFNERRAVELMQSQEPVETFISTSDRFPPSFDTQSEEKFRVYLDTYRRIRKELSTDDILAFLRFIPTTELRQTAAAWLEGKISFDWAKTPSKKL